MLPDEDALYRELSEIGLGHWRKSLEHCLAARLADTAHGDLPKWRATIAALPAVRDAKIQLERDVLSICAKSLTAQDAQRIAETLRELIPWRKGPIRVFGTDIDSEWRSDLKWNRLKNGIGSLSGRNVLDVGCGNGYYALRMLGAGARCVIGIDPGLLFVCQFLALKKLANITHAHVLPLRLEDLPADAAIFDTTFSMGVLYHRRDPLQHLRALKSTLRPGGELVLETLVLPGDGKAVLIPDGRYARMRNVWHLPSVAQLQDWLAAAGFAESNLLHVGRTTTAEQRTTEWMPFESLQEALDPANSAQTVEGLPAPTRAAFLCRNA